ncbi:hypothetical protein [Fluoribacter gormanii]
MDLDRAKTSYPDVKFICEDILSSTKLSHKSFQCIYSCSAFFVLNLKKLR